MVCGVTVWVCVGLCIACMDIEGKKSVLIHSVGEEDQVWVGFGGGVMQAMYVMAGLVELG